MADDFDDLFKSTTSPSAAGGPSTPGWGGFGEDDLTTANPFADLQSSRLYESQITSANDDDEQHHHQQSTPTSPESLARQFEGKASLSRRSTTSSKASTSTTGRNARQQASGGVQRSNSTSSAASTASGAGEDGRTAPSSSEGGQEQRGDRVAVSPFIAPSDGEGENGSSSNHTGQLGRSETTIGEPELGQSHQRRQDEQPFWSHSTSVYDQEESSAFGGGFHDGYDPSSSSTPSFSVHHVDDRSEDAGRAFGNGHEDDEHLRSRDTDAASIRTVGLESDTASLRSHKVGCVWSGYTLARC